MIAIGIAIGFIPAIPNITIDPEVVFPNISSTNADDAAFNINFKEFKTYFNTIQHPGNRAGI